MKTNREVLVEAGVPAEELDVIGCGHNLDEEWKSGNAGEILGDTKKSFNWEDTKQGDTYWEPWFLWLNDDENRPPEPSSYTKKETEMNNSMRNVLFTGINTKYAARKIQEILFELGYSWSGIYTHIKYVDNIANGTKILINNEGNMNTYQECGYEYYIDVSWMNHIPKATMPDGNQYTKEELEEALNSIKE